VDRDGSAVVISAWKVARKLKGSPFFPLAFMIALYAFLLLFPMTFTGIQASQELHSELLPLVAGWDTVQVA
jgi:hypothetical protein